MSVGLEIRRLLLALSALGLVAMTLLTVYGPPPAKAAVSASPSISPTSAPSSIASSSCVMRGLLPDPSCTPGAIDPRVTQANIAQTICVSGYTATVRPPASYTSALKLTQMRAYGDTGLPADYEEDHLVPLELGGAPRDPANLWPEPRVSIGGAAEQKDRLENALHAAVCAGRLSLAEAQRRIATDWTTAR